MEKISLPHEKITSEIDDGQDSVALSDRDGMVGVFPLLKEHAHLGGNETGTKTYSWDMRVAETGEITEEKYVVPGDPKSWTPHLWEYFIVSLNVRGKMLDVGSGVGYTAWWFNSTSEAMVKKEYPEWIDLEVTAIEGLPYNIKNGSISYKAC